MSVSLSLAAQMEPTNDENASNSDFYSEKMKDTIDELCRQPPIRVACPVCGGLLEDQPETLEIVYAHLLESHAIQIDKITKIAIIEEYENMMMALLIPIGSMQVRNRREKTDKNLFGS